ncbi:MAG: nucleotide exchange factor GrpE [bacterium]
MKEQKSSQKQAPNPDPAEAAAPVVEADPEPAEPPELDQLKDRLLRLHADFDNFRKRTQRDRIDLSARANEDLISELLSVIDHFEIGLSTSVEHKTEQAVHDGFKMVYEQLLGTLKKFGLAPLDAQSATFDPHLQEAVSHIPSDEYAPDEIIAQTRRGYKLGDRLLRPVQVVVSSGPGAPRDDGEKAPEPDTKAER